MSRSLDGFIRSRWTLAVLAIVLMLIHLNGLGVPPLAGTEGHRIFPAREMLSSGDYLITTLFGRVYLMKPPLYPWLLAFFDYTFGGNLWVWRLPSVLCHVGTLCVCFVFARRWFGRRGAWGDDEDSLVSGAVAGLAFLMLFVLWQEARTADIDPLNTLTTTLATFCLMDLMCSDPRPTYKQAICAGFALSLAVFTKVIGCLPAIGGVLLGTLIATGQPRRLFNLPILLTLILGVLPTLIWRLTVVHIVKVRSLPFDSDGAGEALDKITPQNLMALLKAVATPVILLIYALPVSVALPLAFHHVIRAQRRDKTAARMTLAIAASVLAGLVLFVLAGQTNERYAYVLLPLLAVLAGGVFPRLHREPSGHHLTRLMLIGSAVAFTITTITMTFLERKAGPTPLPPSMFSLFACVLAVCILAFLMLQFSKQAISQTVIGLIVLIILASVPFVQYANRQRDARSGLHAARYIATQLPPGVTVFAGGMVRYQPEFFYYLGHPVQSLWRDINRFNEVPGDRYLILTATEMKIYRDNVPNRIGITTRFISNKQPCYLIYYLPQSPSSGAQNSSIAP